MKITILFLIFFSILSSQASVVGISTHPLNDQARVLSAQLTGYMSGRHEMGMGVRYTQETRVDELLDVSASGAQDSRSLVLGTGYDFALLREDISQPRVSLKPYFQYEKFEEVSTSLMGVAATIRKGLSANGYEFFPYLAIPTGIKLDNSNDHYVYYSSLSFGASMPFPGANTDKLLFSFEGNMSMGSSSDYIGCLVSWVWN